MSERKIKGKVAIIGSGLIGKSWTMLFISGGYEVSMYDALEGQVELALKDIHERLEYLENSGMLRGKLTSDEQFQLVNGSSTLVECLKDSIHVQECIPEHLDLKLDIFKQLDEFADDSMVLASSSSAIPASKFTESLHHRNQCIIVHPVNPPYYMPLVELVPSPWTSPKILERTRNLITNIGQSPVTLKKEVPGFIQPRIQYAMIMQCLKLIQDGIIDPEDADKLIKEGLGLVYSFIGPLEALHLSHEKGISGFLESNRSWIKNVLEEVNGEPVKMDSSGELMQAISRQQSSQTTLDELADRRKWRDDRLAKLSKLRMDMNKQPGSAEFKS